jgi:ABC-type glycerol-3-phosphate transport system substrate-binding protein
MQARPCPPPLHCGRGGRGVRVFVGCLFPSLSLLTVDCSGNGAASAKQTLSIWYATGDPVERVWIRTLVGQFQTSHPGILVQLAVYPFPDFNATLQRAMLSGHPPDLAYVTPRPPGIPAYVRSHLLLDLD